MPDSLIRIQCMRCRTDIIFITDDGVLKFEEGYMIITRNKLSIYCEICDKYLTINVNEQLPSFWSKK